MIWGLIKLFISLGILLLSVGHIQPDVQSFYAKPMCTDRPEADRATSPTTIWVEVETYYGEWGETRPVVKEVDFNFYISGVLLGELGPLPNGVVNATLPSNNNHWEDMTLEAMAVAIRTFT